MSRGYRFAVLAAFGWLILAAAPEPRTIAKPEQATAEQSIADSLANIAAIELEQAERAKSPPERQPCGPGEYGSNDDLCAQWKAADAANLAAWLNVVSLLAVAVAICLTIQSNRIARDTAKRQLRPYVGTPGAAISNPIMAPRIAIDIKNFGQTPARIIAQDFRVIHFAKENIAAKAKRIFYTIPVPDNAFCDPGHVQSRSAFIDGPVNFSAGDHVFAELTLTYLSFDNAMFWRRISYRADSNSSYVENNKIMMDVHEIDAEDGEGHPPPSNLPKD